MSPRRATERLRLVLKHDGVADGRRIAAPTLLLTGEPGLDRVVPPDETREYLRLVRGAEARVLERTGHIGLVTRPDAFAEIVVGFVGQACAAASQP
jgi:pimeloyl-ACP methyl ester carboxylesterase